MNSPFEPALLSDITLAFDWYSIKITDAIMLNSIDYSNFACFSQTGLSLEEQAASFACQNVPRDLNSGVALSTLLSYSNQAWINTNGFDIMLNWRADMSSLGINSVPGSLNLNVKATVLGSYKARVSPAVYDIPVEFKGSLGPNLSGTNAGAYDYRLNTSLTYSNVRYPWNISLFWRHLPGVWSANYAVQQSTIANNRAVANGAPGLMINYTPTTEIKTKSYDMFDLSGTWDINETWSLRAGVNNLFGKDPISVSSSAGVPVGTDLSTVCSAEETAIGCTNPTSHSLYTNGGFNAGFYDTVGRRFFLGVKAKF
jgi:outer membrane receptor protein involved in Fe transport